MFYDVCTTCGAPSVAELVKIDRNRAYFRCLSGHETFQPLSEYPAESIKMGREWLYLLATYPQGSEVRVKHGDKMQTVEVVGHKAQSLLTGRPAVRVYVKGYGTVLFTRQQMAQWNDEGN